MIIQKQYISFIVSNVNFQDIYYRKAKEDGFRARSAYKLLQIDEEYKIFEKSQRFVDLCCSPGSWSQIISKRLAKTFIK